MNSEGNRPMRILCIGECMAELAPLDIAGDFRLGYAGDTFNTAWYLHHLRRDLPVSYFSAVGQDSISEDMLRFMQESGICTEHVARRAGRSIGLYLISLYDGERSFSYWRDFSAARLLADDAQALTRGMDSADVIYFSGITLAILDTEARARLLTALTEARKGGKQIAFDPNLRPRLWATECEMKTAIRQGAQVSDLVLPSFEDEGGHFHDADPAATARRYADAGATCVIVKNGADAVHFLQDDASGEVAISPASQIVDTTSAGDSFNAGLLATLDLDLSLPDRITMASSVARHVVGGKGALVRLDDALRGPFSANRPTR